jgi:hypothetical protein
LCKRAAIRGWRIPEASNDKPKKQCRKDCDDRGGGELYRLSGDARDVSLRPTMTRGNQSRSGGGFESISPIPLLNQHDNEDLEVSRHGLW